MGSSRDRGLCPGKRRGPATSGEHSSAPENPGEKV